MLATTIVDIDARMRKATEKYGPLASTHEGLGVALEEWNELQDAIRTNRLDDVAAECIDLAAVLVRMAEAIATRQEIVNRSVK